MVGVMDRSKPRYYFQRTEHPDKVLRIPEIGGYVKAGRWVEQKRRVVPTRLARLKGKTITAFKLCKWPTKGTTWDTFPKYHYALVELKILGSTQRMQPENNKCRAAKARVVAIHALHRPDFRTLKKLRLDCNLARTGKKLKLARSHWDEKFIYRPGKVMVPKGDKYNHEHVVECAAGIHFFLTEKEALEYNI